MPKDFGLSHQWNERRREQNAARKLGAIGIARVKGRLQVVAPFHPDFKMWAKYTGDGKWRYRAEFWSFPWARRAEVFVELQRYFSVTVEQPETLSEDYQWLTPSVKM